MAPATESRRRSSLRKLSVAVGDAAVIMFDEAVVKAASASAPASASTSVSAERRDSSSVAPLVDTGAGESDDNDAPAPPPAKARVAAILESEAVSLLYNLVYTHVIVLIASMIRLSLIM